MSEFDNFISRLSDHELAIFVEYRYNGFLEKSKEKIDNEIKNRKLSSEKLANYLSKKLSTESAEELKNCPRCGSAKLFKETSYEEIPFSEFSSLEVASDTHRCRLCGFNPGKEKPKNFFDRINRMVKNIKSKRINKWNSM